MEDNKNDFEEFLNNSSYNEMNYDSESLKPHAEQSSTEAQQSNTETQTNLEQSNDPYANLDYNEALDMVINNFKNSKKSKPQKEEKKKKEKPQEQYYQEERKKSPLKTILVILAVLVVAAAIALCVYFFALKDNGGSQTNEYNIYTNNDALGTASGQLSEDGEELTLTATPNGQSIFIGWAQGSESGNIVSEDAVITVEYSEDTSYYAVFNLTTELHSYRYIEYTIYMEAGYAVVTGTSDGDLTELTLPNVVNYEGTNFKVYKVAANAFSDSNLTRVNISNNLYRIEDHAFYNCSNLAVVSLGDGSNLKVIDDYAFANCTSLERINLPANVTTSNTAFENCPLLTEE